ncbi:MAG: hypothetical protein M3336_04475, partial [Chloroflexota bacterium]|nr:hypothetical protein [Chloroflexota bacterium]
MMMLLSVLCALPLVATGMQPLRFALVPASGADTVRYTFLTASRPSGQLKVWDSPDSVHHAFFEFNDRGRGPRVTERLILGANGIPTAVDVTGNDYFKNAVAERFRTENGRATWQNSAERGSAPTATSFYTAFDGTPEESAVLARALLRAPAHRLALLPGGEARIEKVDERTVHAKGRARTVVQYAISGLDFQPVPIWLDQNHDLFASGSTWSMVIRQGWESTQAELIEAQEAAGTRRASTLAKALAHTSRGALVVRSATLFDAESKTMHPHTTVVVSGNRIAAVGPDSSVTSPKGSEVIEAAGKTLLPGLWDMHVHVQDDDGLFHIAAGVTTVRDLGNDTDELLKRRRKFADGTAIGP